MEGHISDVSLHFGHGVTVGLHVSMPKSLRMQTTNCSWLTLRTCCCLHRIIAHPRIQFALLPSVSVNLSFSLAVVRSDSALELVAKRMLSMLVAEIAMWEPIFLVYML